MIKTIFEFIPTNQTNLNINTVSKENTDTIIFKDILSAIDNLDFKDNNEITNETHEEHIDVDLNDLEGAELENEATLDIDSEEKKDSDCNNENSNQNKSNDENTQKESNKTNETNHDIINNNDVNEYVNAFNNYNITSLNKNIESGTKNLNGLKYTLEDCTVFKLENTNVKDESVELDNLTKTNLNSNITDDDDSLLNTIESDFDYNKENISLNKKSLSSEIIDVSESQETSDSILEQMKVGIKNTSTPRNMNIMLKPQQLGAVNIKIKFLPTGMHLDIIVDNDIAQEAILDNLNKLELMINPNKDISIASINISQRKEMELKENQLIDSILEKQTSKNIFNSKRVNPILYKQKNH